MQAIYGNIADHHQGPIVHNPRIGSMSGGTNTRETTIIDTPIGDPTSAETSSIEKPGCADKPAAKAAHTLHSTAQKIIVASNASKPHSEIISEGITQALPSLAAIGAGLASYVFTREVLNKTNPDGQHNSEISSGVGGAVTKGFGQGSIVPYAAGFMGGVAGSIVYDAMLPTALRTVQRIDNTDGMEASKTEREIAKTATVFTSVGIGAMVGDGLSTAITTGLQQGLKKGITAGIRGAVTPATLPVAAGCAALSIAGPIISSLAHLPPTSGEFDISVIP